MPCVRFFKGPQYLCHKLQNRTGFVLGSKKRKETCFLAKVKVLLLPSTHRNTRNVPSEYLKCHYIWRCVIFYCILWSAWTPESQEQKGAINWDETLSKQCVGSWQKDCFGLFVCSYKQMGIILHLSSVTVLDCYWWYQLNSSLCSYMTTTFVVEAMAAANAQLRWKRMEKHKVCVGFNFPFSPVVLSRRIFLAFPCIFALPRY